MAVGLGRESCICLPGPCMPPMTRDDHADIPCKAVSLHWEGVLGEQKVRATPWALLRVECYWEGIFTIFLLANGNSTGT